jgi:hypothetical protein
MAKLPGKIWWFENILHIIKSCAKQFHYPLSQYLRIMSNDGSFILDWFMIIKPLISNKTKSFLKRKKNVYIVNP